jgi:hypothetical protein
VAGVVGVKTTALVSSREIPENRPSQPKSKIFSLKKVTKYFFSRRGERDKS